MRAADRDQRVPELVVGDPLALVRRDHARAALEAHRHAVDRLVELVHPDLGLVAPYGEQRRLVDHVGELGAGEAGGAGGDKTQWVSPQQQAGFDPASNEVVLVPAQIDGLTITRRVAINARQNWCRWIEVLENPGAAAVDTQVHVNFSLGGQIANSRDLLDEKNPARTSAWQRLTAITAWS